MITVVIFCIWFVFFTAIGVGAYLYRNRLRKRCKQQLENEEHESSKETTYVKYP